MSKFAGQAEKAECFRDTRSFSTYERIFSDIAAEQFPAGEPGRSWGMLYKGPSIDAAFTDDIKEIHERCGLCQIDRSVAVAIMQPGAFHPPYIRHKENNSNCPDNGALRVYRVINGSISTSIEGKVKVITPGGGLFFVTEGTLLSFKAGSEGCVFGIIDCPAFEMSDDVSDVHKYGHPNQKVAI
jgi:hypothetical protein